MWNADSRAGEHGRRGADRRADRHVGSARGWIREARPETETGEAPRGRRRRRLARDDLDNDSRRSTYKRARSPGRVHDPQPPRSQDSSEATSRENVAAHGERIHRGATTHHEGSDTAAALGPTLLALFSWPILFGIATWPTPSSWPTLVQYRSMANTSYGQHYSVLQHGQHHSYGQQP